MNSGSIQATNFLSVTILKNTLEKQREI